MVKDRAAGRVGSGRVRLLVSNCGSGRVGSGFCRVGSKKSDPWTTLMDNGMEHRDNIYYLFIYNQSFSSATYTEISK